MDITTCEHAWHSLERQKLKIQVTRVLQAFEPPTKSHYEVVRICTKPGCFAGETRDGEVFIDVRPGEQPEGERLVRQVSRITPMLKPRVWRSHI